ncbi:hypothetical protein SALBM311S_05270 [Streptomyces alboniger]
MKTGRPDSVVRDPRPANGRRAGPGSPGHQRFRRTPTMVRTLARTTKAKPHHGSLASAGNCTATDAPPRPAPWSADERLSWPRTAGLGAQHVVAMFGASFVAPVLMGLDPNLAIMMSGVATVVFLLATRGRVPSYLGCSLSFVGVAAVIRAQGGSSATVTGAVFVVGAALFLVGSPVGGSGRA